MPAEPRAGASVRSWFDWWFRSRRTGRITIAQFPNVPLWIFLATVALRRITSEGTSAGAVAEGVGVASLSWWALDEVIRGVNPWRRVLGLGGCLAAVTALLDLLR